MALNIGYIKFNGKEYPVKTGYGVLKRIQAETGKDLDLATLGSEIVMYEKVLWHSLQVGLRVHNRIEGTSLKMTLKEKDMEDVLEECYMQFLQLIPKFFTDEDLEKSEAAVEKEVKEKD